MLFAAFWKYEAEDTEKVIEKLKQRMATIEKDTSFAKLVYGPYTFNGQRKGFSVYETDDPDKLASLQIFYSPEMTWKFVPLIDTRKASELYLKMKK